MRRLLYAGVTTFAFISSPAIGLAGDTDSTLKILLPLASGPLEIDPYAEYEQIFQFPDEILAPALPTLKASAHQLSPPLLLELAFRMFRTDRAEAAYWLEVAQARLLYDLARCHEHPRLVSLDLYFLPFVMPYSWLYSDPTTILAARKKVLENEHKWPDSDPSWTCKRAARETVAKDDWPQIRGEVRTVYSTWVNDLEASVEPVKPLFAMKLSDQAGAYGWTSDGWLTIGEIDLPSPNNRGVKVRPQQIRAWQPPDRWIDNANGKAFLNPEMSQRVDVAGGRVARVAGKPRLLALDPDRLLLRLDGQEVVVIAAGRIGPPAVSPDRCFLAYSVNLDLFVAPLCAGE